MVDRRAIQRLNQSAKSFYKAALSRTLGDDERLMKHTYSGADRFDLSDKTGGPWPRWTPRPGPADALTPSRPATPSRPSP